VLGKSTYRSVSISEGGVRIGGMDTSLTLRPLLTGLCVGESPRWHGGRLWFCHWGTGEVVAVDLDGNAEVVLRAPELSPHTIDWLPDGRMLMIARKRPTVVLRQEGDGFAVHADLGGIAGEWNEMTVDGRGNVYVNGTDMDLLAFFAGRAEFRPTTIALVTASGAVRRVAEDIRFGNGMAISPDGRTLVVADSFAQSLVAFDVEPDGGLTNRRTFAENVQPDGICLDAEGAVWTSASAFGGGENDVVRVAEGGEVLARVAMDRSSFAVMLGGPERRDLFVLAAHWNPQDPFGARTGRVLHGRVDVPGAGFPAAQPC
jgi:sugar lactone lactonase YvrE